MNDRVKEIEQEIKRLETMDNEMFAEDDRSTLAEDYAKLSHKAFNTIKQQQEQIDKYRITLAGLKEDIEHTANTKPSGTVIPLITHLSKWVKWSEQALKEGE